MKNIFALNVYAVNGTNSKYKGKYGNKNAQNRGGNNGGTNPSAQTPNR